MTISTTTRNPRTITRAEARAITEGRMDGPCPDDPEHVSGAEFLTRIADATGLNAEAAQIARLVRAFERALAEGIRHALPVVGIELMKRFWQWKGAHAQYMAGQDIDPESMLMKIPALLSDWYLSLVAHAASIGPEDETCTLPDSARLLALTDWVNDDPERAVRGIMGYAVPKATGEPTVTELEEMILQALRESSKLMSQQEIIAASGVGERKVKKALPELERLQIIDRPRGLRSGYRIKPGGER